MRIMILTLLFANLFFLPSPFYNLGNLDRKKCSYEHHCMLHKIPEFEWYYVAYLKDDPAKEPIAASYSAPGVLAEAAPRTARARQASRLRTITKGAWDRVQPSSM